LQIFVLIVTCQIKAAYYLLTYLVTYLLTYLLAYFAANHGVRVVTRKMDKCEATFGTGLEREMLKV